jgi:hypothetical protein
VAHDGRQQPQRRAPAALSRRGLIVSVLPIVNQSRAQEGGFEQTAMNDYLGVKNIEDASNHY